MGKRIGLFLALALAFSSAAFAGHRGRDNRNPQPQPSPQQPQPAPSPGEQAGVPGCADRSGRQMEQNNAQVLEWKRTTRNQFQDRGFVKGTLVGVYPNRNGHLHLDVFLGNDGTGQRGQDTDIEVIYNTEFGNVPTPLQTGVEVIACGDYITSTAQSGPYPASPLGAILHWVHKAMNDRHPSGFLMIDGRLYGQMDAPPRGREPMGWFQF